MQIVKYVNERYRFSLTKKKSRRGLVYLNRIHMYSEVRELYLGDQCSLFVSLNYVFIVNYHFLMLMLMSSIPKRGHFIQLIRNQRELL